MLILPLLDTKSNVSSSIVLGKTSNNSLSSGLGMDMNTIPGRIRIILIGTLSSHIGIRASGLAGYSKGVLGVRTIPVCEFSFILTLGFATGLGFL